MRFSSRLFGRAMRGRQVVVAVFYCTMLHFAAGAVAPSRAHARTVIRIDASRDYAPPQPAAYDEGSYTSPSGHVLGLNSRYLTLDGRPWLPVMGEFHYSRYPRALWEEELLKMKAAGVNIVSTYVIWIHHEEIRGQFDWSGQRDLRAFAQLCAKHGLYLLPRIGPWDHAEVRNGGLPDWVLKQGPTRVNDPAYLAFVREWYGQIGVQLKGLLFKDGGPVIGIQLENEYSKRGPGAGEAHILELKKIAISSGLDVPLYLVTGWDDAVVPPRAVIPVYGGYPTAPWDRSINKLPPAEIYAFRFRSRVAADAGPSPAPDLGLPFLTAEIGGGNQVTYHRRPVIHPDDVAAIFPVMLGSGVNLYGTYMFQGGENPDGKHSTLQESQITGYPNDLPIKSYDFQAPLGEFGEERASFRELKVFQYFVNDFGSELAPMIVHAPDRLPRNPADLSVPRASVRSKGQTGFIFFNNYIRGYRMPARPATQFVVRLPHGNLILPRRPVDIPSGAYFIWPFNLHINGLTIRYTTAQLFTRVGNGDETTIYFEAIPGIPVEFALEQSSIRSINSSAGTQSTVDGVTYLGEIKPGLESPIDLVSQLGKSVRLVVLSAQQAENAWKVRLGGKERLLVTKQDFFADEDARPGRIWLQSRTSHRFSFSITPPLTTPPGSSLPLTPFTSTQNAVSYWPQAQTRNIKPICRQIQPAGVAPPVKLGPASGSSTHGVAEAPPPSPLPDAAKWSIVIPPGSMQGLSNLFLRIDYRGDLSRFYSDDKLLTDNFFNGEPWTIGLKRFLDARGGGAFTLDILPLRGDEPVYFEFPRKPGFRAQDQADSLKDLRVIPEYRLEIWNRAQGQKADIW